MKAYFKDENKIIFNSMDYTEALVGKAFLDNSVGNTIKVEERYDVNDDFDGLVLSVGDKIITEEEVEERIEAAIDDYKFSTQLKSSTSINVAKAGAGEEDIIYNTAHCSVSFVDNTITILDEGLRAYVGGPYTEPKKWVGLLVDLNTKVQGDIYTVEEIDYEDAQRWGAANDTTFVMWVTPDINGKTIKFTNANDDTQVVEITIDFTEED